MMTFEEFVKIYHDYMLPKDNPALKNPHGLPGILLNWRPWELWKVMSQGEFEKHHKVLDVGAMHTYFALFLSQFVESIKVTDSFYWAQRAYMKEHLKSDSLISPEDWRAFMDGSAPNIEVGDADIQDLPYESNSFDRIVNVSVMEHVIDDQKGMKELLRVLKPGGLMLMSVEYNATEEKEYSETDGSYFRLYSDQSVLQRLSVPGMEIKHMVADNPGGRGNLFMKIRKRTGATTVIL